MILIRFRRINTIRSLFAQSEVNQLDNIVLSNKYISCSYIPVYNCRDVCMKMSESRRDLNK